MTPPADAFFRLLDPERVIATASTSGPWDSAAQHGGPPAALAARSLESLVADTAEGAGAEFRVARLTIDILGPVPVGELRVRSRISRSGRSVLLAETEIQSGDRTVVRGSGWWVRAAPGTLPAAPREPFDVPEIPAPRDDAPTGRWRAEGYLSAIDFRFVEGHWATQGPATVWTRTRIPLVEGEPISPLQRAMLVADCGNGVSNELDIGAWFFINPELTVHLAAVPEGEWIGLDARTSIAVDGAGVATSRLFDRTGVFGRGAQALFVAPR